MAADSWVVSLFPFMCNIIFLFYIIFLHFTTKADKSQSITFVQFFDSLSESTLYWSMTIELRRTQEQQKTMQPIEKRDAWFGMIRTLERTACVLHLARLFQQLNNELRQSLIRSLISKDWESPKNNFPLYWLHQMPRCNQNPEAFSDRLPDRVYSAPLLHH